MIHAALLVMVLTSAAEARGGELVVKEHGFAVTLPGTLQGGAPRPDGSTGWKAQSGGVEYGVLVMPLKEPRPPDDVLDAIPSQVPARFKVSNERHLARDGRAGREFLAEDGAGQAMRVLAFADNVDSRIYLVTGESPRSQSTDAAVRAAFASFRFLEPRLGETYAAPDGSFSLRFPGPVRATTPDGRPKHEAEHNGFVYELRLLTLPAEPDPERHLDMVRDSRVNEGLRLVRESRATVAGFPARDIVTEDKEGVAVWTARAIADASRGRLYLLSVLAPKTRTLALSPAAAAFFDTLRLGDAAAGAPTAGSAGSDAAALAAEVGRLDALIPQLEKELKVQAIALPPQAAQRKQAEIDRHRARRSELLTSLASACATQPAASCEALKVQR